MQGVGAECLAGRPLHLRVLGAGAEEPGGAGTSDASTGPLHSHGRLFCFGCGHFFGLFVFSDQSGVKYVASRNHSAAELDRVVLFFTWPVGYMIQRGQSGLAISIQPAIMPRTKAPPS